MKYNLNVRFRLVSSLMLKYLTRSVRCIYNPKNTFCAKNNAEHCSSVNGVFKVRRAREEHAKNTRIASRKYEEHPKKCSASAIRIFHLFFAVIFVVGVLGNV